MKIKNILTIIIITFISQISIGQLKITPQGYVGIGTNNPYQLLHVAGRGYFRTGDHVITIYPTPTSTCIGTSLDKLDFWYTNTGHNKLYAQSYNTTSDSTLKTNIIPLKSGLNTIMKLNSYSYFMKEDKDNPIKQFGFLSQEVENILPEITSKSKDILMIDYNQIIPFLVEAVKEQQSQIETLQAIIYSHENEIVELKKIVNNYCNMNEDKQKTSSSNFKTKNKSKKDVFDKAVLYENTPNPFSTNTEIRFEIPLKSTSSRIIIHDMQGVEIKSYNIQQRDQSSIIINGSELKAGMYLYTLLIDNKIIDTKRMILTQE